MLRRAERVWCAAQGQAVVEAWNRLSPGSWRDMEQAKARQLERHGTG
jgi:hypothetical protein